MNQMLCGYRDDDRLWDEAEAIDEDEDILTPLEKRLEWICDEWKEAREADTYDAWYSVRMMLYGAAQALNYCRDRYEDRMAVSLLSNVAFEYSLTCIQEGKYEGAPA